jgi:hypothetical protein
VSALLAAAGSFYDDVMRELVFALGAALFVGSAFALWKRRADAAASEESMVANSESGDLVQAPIARTVTYMVIGFIVMIAGLGAILNK